MGEIKTTIKKPEAKRENRPSQTLKKGSSQSISSPSEQILFLQRTIGNQAVGRLLKSGALQAKLRIGQPGDIYEQEADRMAERVMRMPEPVVQRKNERGKVKIDEVKGKKIQVKSIPDQTRSFVQRQPEEAKEEGKAFISNIFNWGIGTVDNKSAKTFHGNASQGKSGASRSIMLSPGKWGDKKPIPGPAGEKQNDIDFIFPTKDTPINGKTDSAFKVGSNNATIITDPKDPKNSKIDDYDSYWPHDKAKGLTGYPVQKGAIEKEEKLQKKEASGSTPDVTPELESSISAIRGGGQPLPESVRAFYEPRFGADFGQVRVHTGSQAAETAKSINAKAFTVGRNIAFGAGEYSPDTIVGRKLLAHELTHVVHQDDGRGPSLIQRVPLGEAHARMGGPSVREMGQREEAPTRHCYPPMLLFERATKNETLFPPQSFNEVIWEGRIPLGELGWVDITLLARGRASGAISAEYGPGTIRDLCLARDANSDRLSGGGELYVPARVGPALHLTGDLVAEARYLAVPTGSLQGSLVADGAAEVNGYIGGRVAATYADGGLMFQAAGQLQTGALLTFRLGASAMTTLVGQEFWRRDWNLLDEQIGWTWYGGMAIALSSANGRSSPHRLSFSAARYLAQRGFSLAQYWSPWSPCPLPQKFIGKLTPTTSLGGRHSWRDPVSIADGRLFHSRFSNSSQTSSDELMSALQGRPARRRQQ